MTLFSLTGEPLNVNDPLPGKLIILTAWSAFSSRSSNAKSDT